MPSDVLFSLWWWVGVLLIAVCVGTTLAMYSKLLRSQSMMDALEKKQRGLHDLFESLQDGDKLDPFEKREVTRALLGEDDEGQDTPENCGADALDSFHPEYWLHGAGAEMIKDTQRQAARGDQLAVSIIRDWRKGEAPHGPSWALIALRPLPRLR